MAVRGKDKGKNAILRLALDTAGLERALQGNTMTQC